MVVSPCGGRVGSTAEAFLLWISSSSRSKLVSPMFSKLLVFQAALKIYQLSFQRLCQITSKQPQLRNCFEVYGNKTANHSRRWLMVELTAKNLQKLFLPQDSHSQPVLANMVGQSWTISLTDDGLLPFHHLTNG